MAIVKSNNYIPGKNLTDLALNVDYDRLGEDKIQITVNFAGAPATVTIHKGSIWECNGNRYMVTGADYTFQMDGAGHNYITFTDNPAVDFGSAAAIGTFSAEKQGYYQADNVTRTMKFYVDQANQNYYILLDNHVPDLTVMTKKFDRLRVTLSVLWAGVGTVPFDTVIFDELSSWDTLNYRFVCAETGYYLITCNVSASTILNINVNGAVVMEMNQNWLTGSCILHLHKNDIVTASRAGGAGFPAGIEHTSLCLARLL